MKQYKEKIDWNKVEHFVIEKITVLDSYLKGKLSDLKLVEPHCKINIYPTRILVSFVPKAILKPSFQHSLELINDQEKELKKNLENIANVVLESAEKFNFKVHSGYSYGKDGINYKLGYYTFKPHYREFIIK